MQANQTVVTGPNTAPIRAVPRCWTENRTTMIVRLIHSTHGARAGVATAKPSMAPSTEIAGVMIPSP